MKPLRKLFGIFFMWMVCHAGMAAAPEADFYVSPQGSDQWSGTLAEPNALKTDGPFSTLARARDAVRTFKSTRESDVLVLIRGGTYQLKETVVFGLSDSGVGDFKVTYAAYPNEKPVFSSGREIIGLKRVSEKIPNLHEVAQGKVLSADVSGQFFTLYDGEGMLPRAQSAGFIPLTGGSRTRLHYPESRLKNWSNVADVEIIVRPHHAWISNVLPLESVDEQTQMAHTSIAATYAMNRLHFLKTTESCWVENVLEELDQPGEWVLNTKLGKIYLWPRNNSAVMAPQLIELIKVEGEVDLEGGEDIPVRNLCFRGLTFKHGDRYTLTHGDAGLQHDWDMFDKANALVRLRGTENCVIKQCHFTQSGSGAIRVDLHGQNNQITGNHIEQMGGGGILLCGYGPGTKDVNKNNLVSNNHLHHLGRIYLHSPGVFIWQSGENRVANNLIHHMPYSGMIVSGCMPHFFDRNGRELSQTIRRHEISNVPRNPTLDDVLPYLHTHDNIIEYNDIHNVMEKMGDGNGIYIRGAGSGNVIRRNYIHHLVTPMLMQAAIRTDGGQRDTMITENFVYKCMAQGIILKLNNRAENNIVADVLAPPRGYYLSLREGPLNDAVIQRNIFYSNGKDTTFIDELAPGNGRKTEDRRGRALARAKDADSDYNIYFNTADPAQGKSMLEKQQDDGVDANSLAADPLFVDPENGDFRFKAGSPALALGIKELDVSKMGLLKDQRSDVKIETHTERANHFPKFSWDRIPLYMHIRKARSYTDEEIEFLAKFPLITFEKANGHEDYGSIEEGTLAAAQAVKNINPETKILYYRNVMVHYSGYAANQALRNIPGALLEDQRGNTKLVRNRVEAYDLSNPDLRNWWVSTCSQMTSSPYIDGVFLDGNVKALVPGYLVGQIGAQKKKQTMDGYHLMMQQTREAIGPNALMLANILRARFDQGGLEYLNYFDGSYLEGFSHNVGGASYEAYVAKGIDSMQKAARKGKIVAFTSSFSASRNTSILGIDERHAKVGSDAQARKGFIYPLSLFLICAEEHSYFRVHEGYSANENDRWMRWFPEYDRPLGPPNGPARREGFRFFRTFKHAKVELDIQKRTASIKWHDPVETNVKK